MRAALIFSALALLAGCASTTGVARARLLEDGQDRFTAGADLGLALAQLSPGRPAPAPWPQLALGYRRGVAGLELSARVFGFGLPNYFYTFGAGASAALPLVRAPSTREGFDLSVALDGGYHQINYARAPTHVPFGQLLLTGGFNIPDGDQLVLGLRFSVQAMMGPDVHTVLLPFGGFSIGYLWVALDIIDVHPELVVLYTPVSFNGLAEDEERRGLTIVQLGFGSSFSI